MVCGPLVTKVFMFSIDPVWGHEVLRCEKHPKFRSTSHIYLTNSQAPVSDPHRCFGGGGRCSPTGGWVSQKENRDDK